MFSPLERIFIEDETGQIVEDRVIPAHFRPAAFPESYFIPYSRKADPFFKTKQITVLDAQTEQIAPIWILPHKIPYFRFDSSLFYQGFESYLPHCTEEHLIDLIETFRRISKNLLTSPIDSAVWHTSRLEELALQIATLCLFVKWQDFFRFSLSPPLGQIRECFIGSPSHIFLGLTESKIGAGGARIFERAIWVNERLAVAKGLSTIRDAEQIANEKKALENFNGAVGIIHTFYQGTISVMGQQKLLVFQELYESSLYHWPIADIPLSIQEKIDLIEQLLHGLITISLHGFHGDIHYANIVVSRPPSGKIKGAIIDFEFFTPHFQLLGPYSTDPLVAPPEYHLLKTRPPKMDVWMLGLVFYRLFTKQLLPWHHKKRDEEMIEAVCQLPDDWTLEALRDLELPPFVVSLINSMLQPNPDRRPTAQQALEIYTVHDSRISNFQYP